MRIKIIGKDKFSSREKKYILLLEEDPLFERLIKLSRKKADIPLEGIKVKITKGKKIKIESFSPEISKEINQASQEIAKATDLILNIYQLPPCWFSTIYSVILFNLAIPPLKDKDGLKPLEISYRGSLAIVVDSMKGYRPLPGETRPHLKIIIREGFSYSGFIRELEKHKEEIKRYLGYLPKLPAVKIVDLKLRKEILGLSKKMSDKEISEYLQEKYGSKLDFDPGYETIGKYRRRLKDKIDSLPKSKYFLSLFLEYIENEKDS